MSAPISLQRLAKALGGEITGGQVVAPGPGHSPHDRSMAVRLSDKAPDGFMATSYAGDDWQDCKDHVRRKLGEAPWEPAEPIAKLAIDPADADNSARALKLWAQSAGPRGTPVEKYLKRRGLELPADAGEVLRWNSYCPFSKGVRTTCMVALVRNIHTDEPQAIHRTSITGDGEKFYIGGKDKMALGPLRAGAVKLTPDGDVTSGLGVGEGIESTLSLRHLRGCESLAVWSLLNSTGLGSFPVVSGVEGLRVAVDHDIAGMAAAETVRARWQAAGRDVITYRPSTADRDLNDYVVAAHGS